MDLDPSEADLLKQMRRAVTDERFMQQARAAASQVVNARGYAWSDIARNVADMLEGVHGRRTATTAKGELRVMIMMNGLNSTL